MSFWLLHTQNTLLTLLTRSQVKRLTVSFIISGFAVRNFHKFLTIIYNSYNFMSRPFVCFVGIKTYDQVFSLQAVAYTRYHNTISSLPRLTIYSTCNQYSSFLFHTYLLIHQYRYFLFIILPFLEI